MRHFVGNKAIKMNLQTIWGKLNMIYVEINMEGKEYNIFEGNFKHDSKFTSTNSAKKRSILEEKKRFTVNQNSRICTITGCPSLGHLDHLLDACLLLDEKFLAHE